MNPEQILINERHIENGVRFIDAEATYIGADVKIGRGTLVYPGVHLEGNTVIGENCEIGPCSRIKDAVLNDCVTLTHSVAYECEIGKGTNVGPFAYVRPNTQIGENVKVGDFVEVKNSVIGNNTKIPHLTYVGDSDVGERVNFGCGSVTVNYDGKEKHRSNIGDGAFVGCNSNLVSPVNVGEGAYIAAGSTITDDVPPESLSIARARQVNKDTWKDKRPKQPPSNQ